MESFDIFVFILQFHGIVSENVLFCLIWLHFHSLLIFKFFNKTMKHISGNVEDFVVHEELANHFRFLVAERSHQQLGRVFFSPF